MKNGSKMSTSSKFEDDVSGLRFQYKYCYCKKKTAVKIVDSEKTSKGKLYFVCETRECGFWSWCIPVKQSKELHSDENSLQSVNSGSTRMRQKMEEATMAASEALTTKLEKVEAILQMLTIMMCFCIILAVVAVVVSSLK